MPISIKVSEENYKWLNALSGELRERLQRPVSINEALTFLHQKKAQKLSDLAGTWQMSDKDAKHFLESLKKGWTKWKISSV